MVRLHPQYDRPPINGHDTFRGTGSCYNCDGHAWHNTESRQLRVYVSTDSPTFAQRRLASFVVLIYVPTLLEIVQRNLVLEGPRHLLSLVMRIRLYCTEEEVNLLEPHLNFNGYFGQHEVVLASLLGSQDKDERSEALEIVKRVNE